MNIYLAGGALAAFGALGACSSGSGGAGSAIFDENQILIQRSTTATVASVENLPSNATMNGGLAVNVSTADETLLGNMTVDADFTNSTVTGKASNLGLYEVTGNFGSNRDCLAGSTCSAELVGELDGTLELAGSIAGNTFGGDLTGDITGSNADGTVASTIALGVDGNFLEDSEGLIATARLDGTSANTITPSGGTATTETATASGIFVVAE